MGTSRTIDIEQESEFGGYAGLSWRINDNLAISGEYQATSDDEAIGISLTCLLGPRPRPQRTRAAQITPPPPAPRAKPSTQPRLLKDRDGELVTDTQGGFVFVEEEEQP